MGRLRLESRPRLDAGVVLIVGILVGSIMFSYLINSGPLQLSIGVYQGGDVITSIVQFEREVTKSEKPVAVMFSSKTCPVCKVMEPHWRVLTMAMDLPVDFKIVMLSRDTTQLFLDYGVTETPTFIVFIDGSPVARHVGGFVGDNVTNTMLSWALAAAGIGGGQGTLELFVSQCSSCHGAPESLEYDSIVEWANSMPSDPLASRVALALQNGVPLSSYYGGTQGLAVAISRMTSMGANISGEDALELAILLDSMTVPRTETGSTEVRQEGDALTLAASIGTTFIAGLMASLSPCVFPILLAYTTAAVATGRELRVLDSVKALVASFLGVGMIGAIFMVAGEGVAEVGDILTPAAGIGLLAAGILGYMDVPAFLNLGVSPRRGIVGFSFIYGLLAVQCSFPIVAGALLIIASGGLSTGLPSLAAFAMGVSLPISMAILAGRSLRLRGLMEKMAGEGFKKNSYLILAFMGFVVLAYSLKLVG